MKNPFSVQTPEDISAREAYDLFVDVFTDFYQVPNQGHTFLHGPRGSGKSMMFRYMMPDCQAIKSNSKFDKLEYFSIYVPIKKTDLNIINLDRLENHAQHLLNEHLLVTHISIIVFDYLIYLLTEHSDQVSNGNHKEIMNFFNNCFIPILISTGYEYNSQLEPELTGIKILEEIKNICIQIHKQTRDYINKLFLNNIIPYNGCICSYLDFLFPILCELKKISIFPQKKPFFILIDDADNLNLPQTRILNSWVSYRTSADVSLKISTQLNYKSYRTVTNQTIDSPHDYSEVNIATIYTSSKNKFYKRVKDIVEKRLKIYLDKEISAEDFFPCNTIQENAIEQIGNEIKDDYEKNGKGATAADDVKRYARPDYIKSLKEKRSGSTYSYAGFEQFVSVSSGIVRYFLEPASLMYSELKSTSDDINSIPHTIQDEVLQKYSTDYLITEFEKIFREENFSDISNEKLSTSDMLMNLLLALGGMFHLILISNSSERRVFSIALSSKPSKELEKVIRLGVRYGYLHESTIGNKQGTGRTKLYILSRLLSPYFKLDPTSFAGYKFLNADVLELAISKPTEFIEKMKRDINSLGQDENIHQLKIEF